MGIFLNSILSDINLVVTDIDGTLTDGGMYYGASGETFKRFHVQDGLGVKLLQTIGIPVAIISADRSATTTNRAKKLDIEHCYVGVGDKVAVLESICERLGQKPNQVAYLGDDLQDFDVMKRVGYPVAVGNAHPLIKTIASYVCQASGGEGAFRELAERLITQKGHQLIDVWQRLSRLESQQ